MADDTPKIIVDDDWKSAAAREKQRLAEQAAQSKAAAKPAPKAPSAAPSASAAASQGAKTSAAEPPAEGTDALGFEDLVRMLAMQALSYLGAFPDRSGRAVVALDLARANIDLLAILQDKTRGNLSPEEQDAIDQTLSDLRLSFVDVSRQLDRMAAEGKLKPQGAAGLDPRGLDPRGPGMPGMGSGMGSGLGSGPGSGFGPGF